MKERGILFTKENRLASVEGRKTQTRRVIVPQPKSIKSLLYYVDKPDEIEKCPAGAWIDTGDGTCFWKKPPYQVGVRLYMLEPYQITSFHWPEVVGKYLDDGCSFSVRLTEQEQRKWKNRKKPHMKTSSRFMYKSLARYWFEVTGTRVERLRNISLEDCNAEGMSQTTHIDEWNARHHFALLWDSINKKRGYGWDVNPWVWVVEFKRIEK